MTMATGVIAGFDLDAIDREVFAAVRPVHSRLHDVARTYGHGTEENTHLVLTAARITVLRTQLLQAVGEAADVLQVTPEAG